MVKKGICSLLVAAVMMITTGCFGSFSLTKKVYEINESVNDEWIRSGVTWAFAIAQVYTIAGAIDFILFNLLEFWTGNNPLAVMDDETIERTVEKNGETYRITIGKGKATVQTLTGVNAGNQATMIFDRASSTCSLSNGTEQQVICTIHPKPLNTVDLHYPDGTTRTCKVSAYTNALSLR